MKKKYVIGLILYISLKLGSLSLLIQESKITDPEFREYKSENLICSKSFLIFGCKNYGKDYPYIYIYNRKPQLFMQDGGRYE